MIVKFYKGDELIVSAELKDGEFIKDQDGYTIFVGKRVPALFKGSKQVKHDKVELHVEGREKR